MARERAIANQLAKLLGTSNSPIYAVDDRRRIVFCNVACADWLGVSVEELVGQRCDYDSADSGDRVADLAARLCPPPDAFLAEADTRRFRFADLASNSGSQLAESISLTGHDGENVGVLVIVRGVHDDPQTAKVPGSGSGAAEQLHVQLQQLASQFRMSFRLERLVGESFVIQLVREQVQVAIASRSNVQIIGPIGSGREHIARTIHGGEQPEQAGPLMPLSCSLLDGELLQATVVAFLHRASEAEAAHPATLLLLDADQLNAESQAELLAFFRVPTFGLRTIVTVRRPLVQLADDGDYLRELAYRLSTTTIELPSIAERREDLPLLCQQFVEDFNARGGKQLSGFEPAVLDQLCGLPWEGEVEELAEAVREMCEQADGPLVTEADLARRVKLVSSAVKHAAPDTESIMLDEFLTDVERELLERALRVAKGNKAEAARLLGISRARVIRRAAQLGL